RLLHPASYLLLPYSGSVGRPRTVASDRLANPPAAWLPLWRSSLRRSRRHPETQTRPADAGGQQDLPARRTGLRPRPHHPGLRPGLPRGHHPLSPHALARAGGLPEKPAGRRPGRPADLLQTDGAGPGRAAEPGSTRRRHADCAVRLVLPLSGRGGVVLCAGLAVHLGGQEEPQLRPRRTAARQAETGPVWPQPAPAAWPP